MTPRTIIILYIVLPVLGYLLGAIPFGYLIGRAKGVDIRNHGSGNIGSTNVGRILGRQWGYICFIFDVAKGFLPVTFTGQYLKHIYQIPAGRPIPISAQVAWIIVAAACIVGHMFSIYLRFKGGKGVATSLGVVLGIWPYFTFTGIIVFLIWVGVWGWWRYVSLASITAALSFPLIFLLLTRQIESWHFPELLPLFVFCCFIPALVVLRHRSNIARLIKGTENRGKK